VKKTIYTPQRQTLSTKLIQAREEAGLTQKQVQELIKISQSELSKIEKGQRKVESLILQKLAELYRRPLDFFINEGRTIKVDNVHSEEIGYWVFKTVADSDRSYKSIESYGDDLKNKYVYDEAVQNHKQVKAGDIAVMVDKESVLGFVRIARIRSFEDVKLRRRCPICNTTEYEERKTKSPRFKCNRGHEFPEPTIDSVPIKKFEAFFGSSFSAPDEKISSRELRSFLTKNYNRNMSIQNLDSSFFAGHRGSLLNKLLSNVPYPQPEEGIVEVRENEESYRVANVDERETISRQIKARRGAQKFREGLLNRYNNTCVVTGCEFVPLLEAAHISPYRGVRDNDLSNGLLLRADIHTLFDLDLIGIEPETLTIRINSEVPDDQYRKYEGCLLKLTNNFRPNKDALAYRWKNFVLNK
jgi:putative restriction endonuclease